MHRVWAFRAAAALTWANQPQNAVSRASVRKVLPGIERGVILRVRCILYSNNNTIGYNHILSISERSAFVHCFFQGSGGPRNAPPFPARAYPPEPSAACSVRVSSRETAPVRSGRHSLPLRQDPAAVAKPLPFCYTQSRSGRHIIRSAARGRETYSVSAIMDGPAYPNQVNRVEKRLSAPAEHGAPDRAEQVCERTRRRKSMKLYHTGQEEIRHPDIFRGRKNADFGQGFYLSPDRDFACRWAGANAVINEYELDESGLLIHRFARDAEWFSYIFHNRRAADHLSADVVIGPIANDTIFETFGIISSGFLKPEDALKLLLAGPEYTQAAIKTEKAAGQLRWIRSDRIERLDPARRKAEQDAYDAAFARILQEIVDAEESPDSP